MESPNLNAELPLWFTVAYVTLAAVFLLIGARLLYRLFRGAARRLSDAGVVFGTDPRTRVISFGIAALLFPSVIPWVFYATVSSFIALFSDLPRWWSTNWERGIQICKDAPAWVCVGQASFGFLTAIGSGLGDAYRGLDLNRFPFGDAVFLLTAWAVLAQVFATADAATDSGPARLWLQAAYARLSDAGRQNLRFFVLLAIAGYLSIAAIAAIPGLQGSSQAPPEVTAERLREHLTGEPREVDGKLGDENPFKILEAFLAEPPQPQTTPAAAPVAASTAVAPVGTVATLGTAPPQQTDPVAALGGSLDESRRRRAEIALREQVAARQELVRALTEAAKTSKTEAARIRDAAVNAYQASNVDRKGARERVQHFYDVVAWYRDGVSALEASLRQCEDAIASADQFWRAWSGSMRDDLFRPAAESSNGALRYNLYENAYRVYREGRDACRLSRSSTSLPSRPALGAYLGPFGLVASWLLRTESLPLALIVGMVGFGLLGASCSRFIREHASRSPNAPLIADLSSVIIRGLSAAVVVFLAVEGGLAVFSAAPTSGAPVEPNPYVLLFTCLVAAVFSEDVWTWARRQLQKSFSAGDQSGDKGGAGQPGAMASRADDKPPAADA